MKTALLVLLGLSFSGGGGANRHIVYLEKRGGQVRELSARMHGNEIFLNHLQGNFPKDLKTNPPWYLKNFSDAGGEITITLNGLPPLILKKEIKLEKEESILGEPLGRYKLFLELHAKQEVIPLTEEEITQNELLKPLGIDAVQLKGEGSLWMLEEKKQIVAEEFFLSGHVTQNNKQEPVHVEWAFASDGVR